MPQELLPFPPSYLLVGIYRLISDPQLWRPIWLECKSSLRTCLVFSALFSTISYPFTRLWVQFFMNQASIVRYSQNASFLKLPLASFATLSLVAGQVSWLIELTLKRKLRRARSQAYEMTVKSRAKDPSFWIEYVEEWEHPPVEKAKRQLAKKNWHDAISGPVARMIVLKVLLLPLHFVPFLNTIVSAFLASLTLAETLLVPYFKIKNMTTLDRAVFIAERETELRWLGFFGAVLEKMPIVGIIFSISNRIAIAMYAHDLEKRQHEIKSGRLKRRKEAYVSKTQAVELDLPQSAIGNFPKKNPEQQRISSEADLKQNAD